VVALSAAFALGSATAASAHPLGNFTVNHYDGLHLYADHIVDHAVVDTAEIPTLQEEGQVDVDQNGTVTADERSRYAARACDALRRSLRTTVGGAPTNWQVTASDFNYRPGAIGLRTSRLDCQLTARVRIQRTGTIAFADSFESDRIGWHEITATASGVHLAQSSVPSSSISDELRHYPNDLLSSPLDVRSATLRVLPGAGANTFTAAGHVPTAGFLSRHLGRLTTYFDGLAGAKRLTFTVGLLALVLSILLGAAHALLPGHGKTVMAAYIAGRRGSARDAVIVGATVTLTHTAGVLVLGIALTAFTSLAGESVLGYLGVASGVLIAVIGASLLRSALRAYRSRREHDHNHEHLHAQGTDQHHDHDRSLIGLGVAGGLVPSPAALIVLLGAIGLGRTLFGVALVVGYGVGMAATLTAAGLLLVHVRGRLEHGDRLRALGTRIGALGRITPLATAAVVLVVGGGLAMRSLVTVV
jgi:ABC-type nickel/cobalt efflux system permease component RcnA